MSTARALLLSLVVAQAARASDTFPIAIAEHITADAVPSCLICHNNLSGGLGTVTKPFGIAMRSEGTEFGDIEPMLDALDALDASSSDVDGDATPDVDELRAGTDPNDEADGFSPQYGFFGCAQARLGGSDGALFAALSAALLLRGPAARTLRRKRRGRCSVTG